MTIYQVLIRIKHIFCAKHWRGASIHSPTMYNFVRRWALKYRGSKMIEAIGAPVIENVEDIASHNGSAMVILREPFKSRKQHLLFQEWYANNHAVIAHFQGFIVIFFDTKLQKESYMIRN